MASRTSEGKERYTAQSQGKEIPYPCLLLSALVFLVYFQILFFGFVYLDDNALILDNFEFISKASNILKAFRYDAFFASQGGSYYRPVFTVSFMLDALIGGLSPFIYHLTNLLLHIISSCLVYRLFTGFGYPAPKAFFFSAIFGIHPALSQVAGWLSGRGESLLTIFILGSFLFLVKFAETGKILFYALHILSFILSVFTKETALAAPLIYFLGLKLIFKKKLPGITALTAGWLFSAVFCLLIRSLVLKTAVAHSDYDIMHTLSVFLPSAGAYFGKIFFPFNLSVFPVLKDVSAVYGIISLFLVFLFLQLSKKRNGKSAAFGLIWFAAFLFPVLMYPAHLCETRLYLPFIGILFVLMEIDYAGIFKLTDRGLKILAFSLLLLLSFKTILHSRNFKDRLSFWIQAVETSPSHAFNWNNLGAMYYLEGKFDKAEFHWRKAAGIKSTEPLVHYNLGLLHMNRGNFKEAEIEYLKEIEINPGYANVYSSFGFSSYKEGKLAQAQTLWKKAVELNPGNRDALNNLAAVSYELGKRKK